MSASSIECIYRPDFSVTVSKDESPYDDMDWSEAKVLWGKDAAKELKARRDSVRQHNQMLARLPIADVKVQTNLLDQVISALGSYPIEKRTKGTFEPFVYMPNPAGAGFLISDVKGSWDRRGHRFQLESIVVTDIQPSWKDMQDIMGVIQTLNPGVPKLGSSWFNLIVSREERVELV